MVWYGTSGADFRDLNLLAIQIGHEGDLTGTDAIVWTDNCSNSYTPSPVIDGCRLYFATDTGLLSCLNARTGEAYYREQRLCKPYGLKLSPVGGNGGFTLPQRMGVVVVRMGEKFELPATNSFSDLMFIDDTGDCRWPGLSSGEHPFLPRAVVRGDQDPGPPKIVPKYFRLFSMLLRS